MRAEAKQISWARSSRPNSDEDGRERPERVRLDHVDADLEERGVKVAHEVGAGEAEHVDAALALGAAVVVDGWLPEMEVGADGAVEDDDALVHHVQKGHDLRLPAACRPSRAVQDVAIGSGGDEDLHEEGR